MNRYGKITSYNEELGTGYIQDYIYRDRTMSFVSRNYQAGQIVEYDTRGFSKTHAIIIAPKLWKQGDVK